ncbi:MAG TPA: hypothetical protein PKD42_14110 [Chitinophagaceae bacterium]|nr:hypothetical protein [Chitinophagaceae bacterium]
MRRKVLILVFSFFLQSLSVELSAQCSVCTKTAQQMGEQPAKGMNSGIIYLAAMPLALVGFISFRWWKNNKDAQT